MIEILLIIVVVRAFLKLAEKKGLNKTLWGVISVISYLGPLFLMGRVIFPQLVINGIIPYGSKTQYLVIGTIANILTGVLGCLIAYFILKKQETKPEQESIEMIENYINKKED